VELNGFGVQYERRGHQVRLKMILWLILWRENGNYLMEERVLEKLCGKCEKLIKNCEKFISEFSPPFFNLFQAHHRHFAKFSLHFPQQIFHFTNPHTHNHFNGNENFLAFVITVVCNENKKM
jgi:hypothetical protein